MEPQTLVDVVLAAMRERNKEVAYHEEAGPGQFRAVHWPEARSRTLAIAAALRARGFLRGDRCGIWCDVRSEWVSVDFANILLGLVTIGIYPTLPADQTQYILAHAEVGVLFVEKQSQIDAIAPLLPLCPNLGLLVGIDPNLRPPDGLTVPMMNLESLVQEGLHLLMGAGEESLLEEAQKARPDDLVTVVYTSGTTGKPKGAMLTHRNLVYVTVAVGRLLEMGSEDRSVVYLPLAHILQRYTVYLGVHLGIQAWYTRDIANIGDTIRIVRPTVLAAVPRVLEKIHARAQATADRLPGPRKAIFEWSIDLGHAFSLKSMAGEPLSMLLRIQHRIADRLVHSKIRERLGASLRFVVSGGAPLAQDLSKWFHAAGILVIEGYGLTETSAPATTNLPQAFRFGTVGRAIPGTTVRIADDGEILVRGPGVFTGYWKDDEATRAAMTDDGFFRTGDVGTLDPDGFLRITDRKKDILITASGKNVPPANIENLIKEHRLIGQAIVVGDRRPYLVALVALDPDEAPGWASEQGHGDLPLEQIAQLPDVQQEVARHMASTNGRLARFESVKAWSLLPTPFTVENGLLTPTLKLRRREILQRFPDVIEALYRREAGPVAGE